MGLTNFNKEKISRKSSVDLGTMVFGKIPPQAKELEEVVLGAMMLDKNCVAVGMSRLFPEMFYVEAHQKIFRAMQNDYDLNVPIDLLNVVERLRKNEDLEFVGGPYCVTKLTNSVVSGANIESHILVIAEKYLSRELIRISGESIGDAYEENVDVWDSIARADNSIQKMQERVLTGMSKDIGYFGIKVLDQHATVKQTGVLGIKTNINAIDKSICGLVPPDLVIIAARPGQGKTAFALSITYETSIKNKVPCAWFSLEMDGVQLVRRLAAIDSKIDHERIRNGTTSFEEDRILGESISRISSSNIHIEDKTSMNIRDIRTKASLLKKKYNIEYIVVDYIQLMSGIDTKGKNREQIVSEISRDLKCIAKELEMPVIALSQLSRAVESRNDKMPQLSDLRESGAIEQDADCVIFLMRPEYYGMKEATIIGDTEFPVSGLCIGNVAKNRHGSTKNIAMRFTGNIMHFTDYEKEFYISPSLSMPYKEPEDDDMPF